MILLKGSIFVIDKIDNLKNNDNVPSYADLLATYGLETLELRRLKICLNLFHELLHGLLPIKTDAFHFIPTTIRGEKFKIVIQPATNDVRFNSFFIRYARIYSQLNSKIRNTNPNEFANLLHCTDLTKFLNNNL